MSDSPNEGLEHAEHAEHAAHSQNPMLILVSATIAVLAVMAATVGSLETLESGSAISSKNSSVLFQDQATDTWAQYQAESIKRNLYEVAAATNPAKTDDFTAKAQGYAADQTKSKSEAQRLEHERDEAVESSEAHERRHRVLTVGVTMIHVSIAIATISIITGGKRWPWYTAMALGAAGALVAAYAYT